MAVSRGKFEVLETMTLDSNTFGPNIQLLTTEPLMIKEYANWCSLKKFYMTNTKTQFNALKRRAEAVLQLLNEEYHFK